MVTCSLTKELKLCSGKETAFSPYGAVETGGQYVEKCKLIHSDPLFKKLKSKYFHIIPDTLKLLEEKLEKMGKFPEQSTHGLCSKIMY